MPLPRKQTGKVKELRSVIKTIGAAIGAKRWDQARFSLGRARALANALPADVAVEEREQLSRLRKKYAARNTPAAKQARKASAARQAKPKAAGRGGLKKPAPRKSAARTTAQRPKPEHVRDLGDRYINRAALGYGPPDETKRTRGG